MRLINADLLIKTIKNSCSMGGYMGKVVDAIYEYFIKVVESMPTAVDTFTFQDMNKAIEVGRGFGKLEGKTERSQGEWIPVSERLPEKMGTYLVTLEYKEHGIGITTIWYHGKGIGWDLRVADEVIAWQPLPEPYKKGGAT